MCINCCICLYSYIKPQQPVSHFPCNVCCICLYSYIKPQRRIDCENILERCICLYSYIKPQPLFFQGSAGLCCICLYSYIKPQQFVRNVKILIVVYVSIPTSNHNLIVSRIGCNPLYMSLFLHQTTTICANYKILRKLYMSLFLHQTTTILLLPMNLLGCICLYSYIKPQPLRLPNQRGFVVYVSIPTSNHNC